MLTLTGPGGIGKTRLALRTLTTMAAEFPDGACYVDLADLTNPDLVTARVASAAGVAESTAASITPANEIWCRSSRSLPVMMRLKSRRSSMSWTWARAFRSMTSMARFCSSGPLDDSPLSSI